VALQSSGYPILKKLNLPGVYFYVFILSNMNGKGVGDI
jgi:hypothetical protein